MLFGLVGLLMLIGGSSCQSNSHITRQHPTDQFLLHGNCLEDACVEESSGTAELVESCTCKCLPHLPVFREDLHICVDDIHECTLAPFVTGSTHQKVPYVFLPLKGQIIHPSSTIQFTDVTAPICVVSGAKYLTRNGWAELRNKSEAEPPFRLLKDEGKTYLQWLGESGLRLSMEGRLILIHLLCKDMDDIENQKNNIFTPCVSFRVAGTPSDTNAWSGVREVSFSVDSQNNTGNIGSGYISVALCSVVIGLIYVASVVLYIQLRKKNTNQKKPPTPHIGVAEEGIVKNNPLLRHCHDNLYLPESTHSCSDSDGSSDRIQLSDDSTREPAVNVEVTSAVVHPCSISREKENNTLSNLQSQENVIEKHPEENVSIIETLETREDKTEKICAIACSNVRRKLYFNPSFLQHELLLAPPPAAIEFLTKIREVISIAKSKIHAKRFSPTLLRVPEESENKSSDGETCNGSRLNQYAPSVNSNKLFSSDGLTSCRNCCKTPENKQRSVEKWLANVPAVSDEFGSADDADEKASVSSEWITDDNSLDKLRNFFQQDDDAVSSEDNPSEFKENYSNRKLVLYDNVTKKKGEMLKGDKTPDILYTIPIISTTEETVKNNNNQITSSTTSFKDFSVNGIKQNKDDTTLSQTGSSLGKEDLKPDGQTSQYELIGSKTYEGEENSSELETMKFKGGFAVSCNYIDIHNTKVGIEEKELSFPYYLTENPYTRTSRAMSEIGLNEKKDDHDYEMIMLNNIEETKSLPDFCSRSGGYSLISEVYVNSGFGFSSSQSSINSNNDSNYSPVGEKQVQVSKDGLEHLTINIKESPTNHTDEDSDNFEPDTLDRKPNNLIIPGDMTSKLQINNDFFTDSLERQAQISLKSTGSFRKDFGCVHSAAVPNRNRGVVLNRAFGSLREIFMAKNNYNQCTHRSSKPGSFTDVPNCTNYPDQISNLYWNREKYLKTLKPESKQAKRQRQPDPPNHSLISPPQPPDFMIDLPNESNVPALPKKSFKLNMRDDVHDCDRVSSLSYPFDLMCNKSHPFEQVNGANRHMAPLSKSQIEPRLNLRTLERFANGVCHLGSIENSCTGSDLTTGPVHLADNLKINHISPKIDKSAHQANLLIIRTEDSGYLSTDSNTSDKPLRRDGSLSETDDSFFDGASESGAESIATDSFFFGKTHQNSLAKPLETQS